MVSGSSIAPVRVGMTILVSASGLVISGVTIPSTSGETVRVGMAELTSRPELLAVGGVLCGSLWETFRVALVTVGLVSMGWVTHKVEISSGSPKETVRVGTAELVSAPELGTSAGMVSGPLLNIGGIVLETAVLISVAGLVSEEAVISTTSGETSGVVMITPAVLVLAILSEVLWRVSILKVGVETFVVKVAVLVISALSVPPAGRPVNCGMATQLPPTGLARAYFLFI